MATAAIVVARRLGVSSGERPTVVISGPAIREPRQAYERALAAAWKEESA